MNPKNFFFVGDLGLVSDEEWQWPLWVLAPLALYALRRHAVLLQFIHRVARLLFSALAQSTVRAEHQATGGATPNCPTVAGVAAAAAHVWLHEPTEHTGLIKRLPLALRLLLELCALIAGPERIAKSVVSCILSSPVESRISAHAASQA